MVADALASSKVTSSSHDIDGVAIIRVLVFYQEGLPLPEQSQRQDLIENANILSSPPPPPPPPPKKKQKKQGKSEGFESCDRPRVWKRPIWVKIGDILSRVTLKFDGWPWKTIGHLPFAVSSFVQHFIAIGKFKLELQSGNAQFGSNSTNFRAVWPWNLTDDLDKQ